MPKISDKWYLVIYLLLISMAEITTVYFNIQTGIIFHAAILSALFIHSGFITKAKMFENWQQWLFIEKMKKPSESLQTLISRKRKLSILLLVFTLVPLIRILSLVMPLSHFPRIQWFIIIAIALYLAFFALVRQQKIDLKEHGFRLPKAKHIPIEIGIILIAAPFGYIEYFILRPDLLIDSFALENLIEAILILFVATGLIEEIIFRGLLLKKSIDMIGTWQGILFVTLIFAVLHIGNLSLLDVLLVFCIGVLYAVVVKTTKTIIGVTISHTVVNIFLFIICPFTLI